MPQLMTDRPIKLAVVGAGNIAKKHIAAIKQFSADIQLLAIVDANREVLKAATQEYGIDGYENLEQLLMNCDADVVSICTPTGLHAQQTLMAADSGRHVICEKPMATRWQDALDMVRVCDDNDVNLFVVKQNRATPTLQLLKQAIDAGRFGRIYQLHCNVFWTRPPEYYSASRWRGTWEFDGGALMNQASHYVDLLHWLVGPVERIHAMMATQARQIESEDSCVLNLRWRHGALGSMSVSMLTYPKNLEASLTLLGEKGTVKIGGVALNQIEHWQFADKQPMDDKITEANTQTTERIGAGHLSYYQNVIDTLRGKAQPETDGREGLKTMELLIAAYVSARDGKAIMLPLEY